MMMQTVSRHLPSHSGVGVQIKPLSEAIKSTNSGSGFVANVSGPSSQVQAMQTIEVNQNRNVTLRQVMEAAKDSVEHPLEEVDIGMMSDLQLPLWDRLYLKIWCLKSRVSVDTVHKLETKKAQEAVKKINKVLIAYRNDILQTEQSLEKLDRDINQAKFNLNNALQTKSTSARIYRGQLKRLVENQVRLENEIKNKEILIRKGEGYINMLSPKEQGLNSVIKEYASDLSVYNIDRAMDQADDEMIRTQEMIDHKLSMSEAQDLALDSTLSDEFEEEVKSRLDEILNKNVVSFTEKDYHKIVPPVVKRSSVVRPDKNNHDDDDDDNAAAHLESASLLPLAPETKIQRMATEMQLEHITKTAQMI